MWSQNHFRGPNLKEMDGRILQAIGAEVCYDSYQSRFVSAIMDEVKKVLKDIS